MDKIEAKVESYARYTTVNEQEHNKYSINE